MTSVVADGVGNRRPALIMTSNESEATLIRLLIADNHSAVRERVKRILAADAALSVVAEAASGFEALDLLATVPVDVALIDISMPGPRFVTLLQRLRFVQPALRILVVSINTDEAYVQQVLRSGAAGFVAKDRAADDLIEGIYHAHRGERFVSLGRVACTSHLTATFESV